MRPILLTLLFAAAVCGGRARASLQVQPLDAIRAAAVAALGVEPAQAKASVSPGVRLAACAQPLQALATGARTALVRCPDSPGWKLYVPVRVRREADVVVLRGPVAAGEAISAAQLVVQRRDLGDSTDTAIVDPAAVVGLRPTHALAGGAVVTAEGLNRGPLLRRGDPVVLVTRIGGIEVRVGGRVLGRPSDGGVVNVENVESHRSVRGRITGPGVVEVMP